MIVVRPKEICASRYMLRKLSQIDSYATKMVLKKLINVSSIYKYRAAIHIRTLGSAKKKGPATMESYQPYMLTRCPLEHRGR